MAGWADVRRAVQAALFLGALGAPAAAQAPAPAVTVATAEMRDVGERYVYTGRIVALRKVALRARVSGYVEARSFEEGARVAEGDVLFRIESGVYEAAVAEAEGALMAARSRLDLAKLERDRQAELVARGSAPQAALDRAVAELGGAEGEVTRLEGTLERARLELSWAEVRAPFAGRVGLAAVDASDLVGPETGPLATVVAEDPTTAEFPVPMATVLRGRARSAAGDGPATFVATLRLSDGSAYPEPGRIDFIDVTVNPGADTVLVRAVFPNPDRILVDGALVTVELALSGSDPVLTAPRQAVQRDLQGTFVLVVGEDGVVELRRIEVARQVEDVVVVSAGLSAGERVIVEGLNKARPGATVDAAPAAE